MNVNTEKTEIALQAASTEISNFVTDAKLEVQALVEKYGPLVPIATTPEGYANCKEVRADLMPIKTKLEAARKSLKDPIIKAGKLIDSSIKPLADVVEGLYKPFEKAYREVDQEKKNREINRQVFIADHIAELDNALVSCAGSTSTVIEAMLDNLADFNLDPKIFMEREAEARSKYLETMRRLGEMLTQALQHEEVMQKQIDMEAKEAAMLKREEEFNRKEELEASRLENEARAEEMREAAEKAAKDAKEQAEIQHNEYVAAQKVRVAAAVEQAAADERFRIEEKAAILKREADAREANEKHKGEVHKDILVAFMVSGATEKQCKAIIKLIAQRRINNISIQY